MVARSKGFTLIELSIVLIIVGLVVGGVLVGRDLISASTVRAQISQIDKYQQAVNTFRGKYAYLPGDIPDPDASKFGFVARGSLPGQGDGNGFIQDNNGGAPTASVNGIEGESTTLWVDLSTAKLVDGGFTRGSPTSWPGSNITTTTSPTIAAYLPAARAGNAGYIYVYNNSVINYFGISAVVAMGSAPLGSSPSLTVQQAYAVDMKMDDGFPQTGRVVANYVNWGFGSGNPGYGWAGTAISGASSYTTATAGSASSCFDNGGVVGMQNYSITQNNGTGVNCALSFRFQ